MKPTTRLTLLWSLRIGILEAFAWIGIWNGNSFHENIDRAARAYPVALWSAFFGALGFWVALKLVRIKGEPRYDFWPFLLWGALLMEGLWGSQTVFWPLFKVLIENYELRFWSWAFLSSTLGAYFVYHAYFACMRFGFHRILIRWQEKGARTKTGLSWFPAILLLPFGVYETLFGYCTLRLFHVSWSLEHPIPAFFIWFGSGFILSALIMFLTRKLSDRLGLTP